MFSDVVSKFFNEHLMTMFHTHFFVVTNFVYLFFKIEFDHRHTQCTHKHLQCTIFFVLQYSFISIQFGMIVKNVVK